MDTLETWSLREGPPSGNCAGDGDGRSQVRLCPHAADPPLDRDIATQTIGCDSERHGGPLNCVTEGPE